MGHTFLIAECASTHDGDIVKALELIRMARDAGFDAAKFQYWSDAQELSIRRKVSWYYHEIYKRYQIPRDWLDTLRLECDRVGIEFMCTTYLPGDVPVMTPYVKRHKLSSFELMATDMMAAMVESTLPVVMSTGMASMNELDALYDKLPKTISDFVGNVMYRSAILHCTSAYPTPLHAANLGAIRNTRKACPYYAPGLSDHTANTLTGAVAVGAGAEVIEVHVRHLRTHDSNPDYAVSLLVSTLGCQYVRLVREAEVLMGSGVKEPHEVEAAMEKYRVKA